MHIRPERPDDIAAIRAVNVSAFATSAEADLVDALRHQASPVISLVADEAGDIVGHILLSPVALNGSQDVKVMGLAPIAVIPGHQRQGIGAALVREGLGQCRRIGAGVVVVLGDPGYYSRFGFVPASRFGLKSEYNIADDVFMAIELQAGSLNGRSGIIRYHPAFAAVQTHT